MPMSGMPDASVFIDSTTFLYSHDITDPAKRDAARRWLASLTVSGTGRSNLQVLNEVTNVLIRKTRRFGDGDVFARVDTFSGFGTDPLTRSACLAARDLHRTYRYSWWDCVLLASALELGCTHFLSEDLQDGQAIEGLTIVDPFAHTPQQILISR